jgi:hypothetical protein
LRRRIQRSFRIRAWSVSQEQKWSVSA